MSQYSPASPIQNSPVQNPSGSPGRYIPKAVERRQQPNTDWAELVRYQQAMAEQMIQQEKTLRLQQKQEMSEALGSLVREKQEVKRKEWDQKQNDYVESVAAKQNFDQYLNKVKNDKVDFQKMMGAEYDRERGEKNDNQKTQLSQEMRVEKKIVDNALDSLERERQLNQQRKMEWTQSQEQMMREKELQKQRERMMFEQNRQEHNRLLDENAYNLDMKDLNYKLYYQKIGDKQANRQQVFDAKVGAEERNRDKHLEDFVVKGVYDAKRKAEEEEMRRQMKRQEQVQSTVQSIKTKMNEHEDERYRVKASYQDKVENLRRFNQELDEQNNLVRQMKVDQSSNYKQTLEEQMRQAEELKRIQNQQMLNHEKKMHLEKFDGLIPGIRSSKFDSLINPQMKTMRERDRLQASALNLGSGSPVPFDKGSSDFYSPTGRSSGLRPFDSPIENYNNQPIMTPKGQQSPFSANINRRDVHNPITNPMPKNVQNPYLLKDVHKGVNYQRNFLAGVADKNLLA